MAGRVSEVPLLKKGPPEFHWVPPTNLGINSIKGQGGLRDNVHLSHLFIVDAWKAEVNAGPNASVGTSDSSHHAANMYFVE
jgi:hypothetical protein